MKNTQLFSSLFFREIKKNQRSYLVIIIVFLSGIITGTFFSAVSDSLSELQHYVDTFLSSYSLQGAAKTQVFRLSLWNYLKFGFFFWVSGWHLWLFPLCFLQLFSKGFRIGFTVACFVQCYSFRGVIMSMLTMLFQNFIFLPILFFYAAYQFQFLSERRVILAGSASQAFRKQVYGKNILFCLVFLLALLLCSFIEGYFVPTLLQPLCNFFMS